MIDTAIDRNHCQALAGPECNPQTVVAEGCVIVAVDSVVVVAGFMDHLKTAREQYPAFILGAATLGIALPSARRESCKPALELCVECTELVGAQLA